MQSQRPVWNTRTDDQLTAREMYDYVLSRDPARFAVLRQALPTPELNILQTSNLAMDLEVNVPKFTRAVESTHARVLGFQALYAGVPRDLHTAVHIINVESDYLVLLSLWLEALFKLLTKSLRTPISFAVLVNGEYQRSAKFRKLPPGARSRVTTLLQAFEQATISLIRQVHRDAVIKQVEENLSEDVLKRYNNLAILLETLATIFGGEGGAALSSDARSLAARTALQYRDTRLVDMLQSRYDLAKLGSFRDFDVPKMDKPHGKVLVYSKKDHPFHISVSPMNMRADGFHLSLQGGGKAYFDRRGSHLFSTLRGVEGSLPLPDISREVPERFAQFLARARL